MSRIRPATPCAGAGVAKAAAAQRKHVFIVIDVVNRKSRKIL